MPIKIIKGHFYKFNISEDQEYISNATKVV